MFPSVVALQKAITIRCSAQSRGAVWHADPAAFNQSDVRHPRLVGQDGPGAGQTNCAVAAKSVSDLLALGTPPIAGLARLPPSTCHLNLFGQRPRSKSREGTTDVCVKERHDLCQGRGATAPTRASRLCVRCWRRGCGLLTVADRIGWSERSERFSLHAASLAAIWVDRVHWLACGLPLLYARAVAVATSGCRRRPYHGRLAGRRGAGA
jgi:hypothetical protein